MIGILETSHYLPRKINTNEDVCKSTGLTEEWIIEKTGIKRRYHVFDAESTGSMAIRVAHDLIRNIDASEVGLIIIASFSQDYMLPPLSAKIHASIGAGKDCQIIDINVNCVGLITGTTLAVERMKADPRIRYAIVIGTEILSAFVDKRDKFTAPFFSDGASGVLLGKSNHGYIDSMFCTDSSTYEDVRLKRGGNIEHNGKATWTQAITNLPYVLNGLVRHNYISLSDINFFIFHQANKVLIDYIMDKNKIPRSKTFTNVEEIGNTGAASIGIALDQAIRGGFIKKGDLLIMAGVGAGFNFGANLWRI